MTSSPIAQSATSVGSSLHPANFAPELCNPSDGQKGMDLEKVNKPTTDSEDVRETWDTMKKGIQEIRESCAVLSGSKCSTPLRDAQCKECEEKIRAYTNSKFKKLNQISAVETERLVRGSLKNISAEMDRMEAWNDDIERKAYNILGELRAVDAKLEKMQADNARWKANLANTRERLESIHSDALHLQRWAPCQVSFYLLTVAE